MRGDDFPAGSHGIDAVPAPLTLADVIERARAHPHLHPRRQRELISAVRTVCRGLSLEPALVAADPRALRKRFEVLSAATLGVTKGRFTNLRSLTLAAVKLADVKMMPGRSRAPLLPQWEGLRALLPDRYERWKLGRFMHFCTLRSIVPGDVTQATFSTFSQTLDVESLVKRPVAVFRDTRLTWNRSSSSIPWPALVVSVPDRTRRYAPQMSDFTASFGADAEAFLNRLANQDPLADDYAKPA